MSIRTQRVGAMLREALAAEFQKHPPEYLDGLVTVVSVKVSPDLSIAKVYVSIWNSKTQPEILVKRLNENSSDVRTAVAREVNLRRMPELRFYRDDTLDTAERIQKLLDDVRHEDKRTRGFSPLDQEESEESESPPHDSDL